MKNCVSGFLVRTTVFYEKNKLQAIKFVWQFVNWWLRYLQTVEISLFVF